MLKRVYHGWIPHDQTQTMTLWWFVAGGKIVPTRKELLEIYGEDCKPVRASVEIIVRHET